jgi:hypothetical protein
MDSLYELTEEQANAINGTLINKGKVKLVPSFIDGAYYISKFYASQIAKDFDFIVIEPEPIEEEEEEEEDDEEEVINEDFE